MEPTNFDDLTNQMKIAIEEIFGPVLSVITFETEGEAIQIANNIPYGLAASLWADDLARAHRVSRKLRAGSVSVNTADSYSPVAPHGGYKESGISRNLSTHALDNYTQLKPTWFDHN